MCWTDDSTDSPARKVRGTIPLTKVMTKDAAGTPPAKAGERERGIDRVLQLFEYLHHHRQPIRIGALAKGLNAPRSTIYNLVNALVEGGLLEIVDDEGRVFFGKTIYLYGSHYMRENELVRRGREAVDRLSRETGETAELCMLQNGRYTIIHMCQGDRTFRISSAIGLQIPIPWTASGRLLLAHLDADEIRTLIRDEDRVLPDGREVETEEFLSSVAEARRNGYCTTVGLIDAFTMCIAAPIYGASGKVEATICFVVPKETPEARTKELIALLLQTGQALSVRPE